MASSNPCRNLEIAALGCIKNDPRGLCKGAMAKGSPTCKMGSETFGEEFRKSVQEGFSKAQVSAIPGADGFCEAAIDNVCSEFQSNIAESCGGCCKGYIESWQSCLAVQVSSHKLNLYPPCKVSSCEVSEGGSVSSPPDSTSSSSEPAPASTSKEAFSFSAHTGMIVVIAILVIILLVGVFWRCCFRQRCEKKSNSMDDTDESKNDDSTDHDGEELAKRNDEKFNGTSYAVMYGIPTEKRKVSNDGDEEGANRSSSPSTIKSSSSYPQNSARGSEKYNGKSYNVMHDIPTDEECEVSNNVVEEGINQASSLKFARPPSSSYPRNSTHNSDKCNDKSFVVMYDIPTEECEMSNHDDEEAFKQASSLRSIRSSLSARERKRAIESSVTTLPSGSIRSGSSNEDSDGVVALAAMKRKSDEQQILIEKLTEQNNALQVVLSSRMQLLRGSD